MTWDKYSIVQIVFTALILGLIMFLGINFVGGLFEPPIRCSVYQGSWDNMTYMDCFFIEDWCDDHNCTKRYGNCGRPICVCEFEGGLS